MLALFWPFLTAAAAILVGMRFPSPSGAGPAPTDLLELLWLAHVVGCAAVVAFARGFRLVAGAALSLGTFVFAGCSLVAAMSVTGTWL